MIQHLLQLASAVKGAPTVDENVFIGCRACVLVIIKIGNKKIGAGGGLKDVNNCTVVGVPAHIVSKTD